MTKILNSATQVRYFATTLLAATFLVAISLPTSAGIIVALDAGANTNVNDLSEIVVTVDIDGAGNASFGGLSGNQDISTLIDPNNTNVSVSGGAPPVAFNTSFDVVFNMWDNIDTATGVGIDPLEDSSARFNANGLRIGTNPNGNWIGSDAGGDAEGVTVSLANTDGFSYQLSSIQLGGFDPDPNGGNDDVGVYDSLGSGATFTTYMVSEPDVSSQGLVLTSDGTFTTIFQPNTDGSGIGLKKIEIVIPEPTTLVLSLGLWGLLAGGARHSRRLK